MILISIVLVLLTLLGTPLFAIIATSAMVGFHRDETDLMNMALEIQSIADLPFLAAIPDYRRQATGSHSPATS